MGNRELERDDQHVGKSVEKRNDVQRVKFKPFLKKLCDDCIKIILLYVVRNSSDVIKFQTLNQNFFRIVKKNHWITNNVIYKIYRYPKKPQTQVTQLFFSSSNFRKYEKKITVSTNQLAENFPNLVELTLYSNTLYRSGTNIQISTLQDLNIKYLRISEGYLENNLEFPKTLKSLILIKGVRNLRYGSLSTIPKLLVELVLNGLYDFPELDTLQSLSFLTKNGIQHHLERLTIRNCGFRLSVYEDDIPLFKRLKYLNIGLSCEGFGGNSFVLVEVVEKLRGSNWGELKELEHLELEGGSNLKSGKYRIWNENERSEITQSSNSAFKTPFEFEKFPSFFPCLVSLEISNILNVKLSDIKNFERLRKVKVMGKFGNERIPVSNGSTLFWINKNNESCTLHKN